MDAGGAGEREARRRVRRFSRRRFPPGSARAAGRGEFGLEYARGSSEVPEAALTVRPLATATWLSAGAVHDATPFFPGSRMRSS
jgi:hypothetical protein